MTKQEIVKNIGKPFFIPIGILQLLMIIAMISAPFIWIWNTWHLAIKVFMTGVIGTAICYFLDKLIRSAISDIVEKKFKKSKTHSKSKFQTKIDEMKQKIDDQKNRENNEKA